MWFLTISAYSSLMPSRYTVLTVFLLFAFVIVAAVTSYRSYVSDAATNTLSTNITDIAPSEEAIFYATGYSAFPFEFTVNVWNSYGGVQKLKSPTDCGFEISILSATINVSVDMFRFGGVCSDVPTVFRYSPGNTRSTIMRYLRVFSDGRTQVPVGDYVFSYKFGYATNKVADTSNITLRYFENGSYIYFAEDMPTEWGSTALPTSAVPAPYIYLYLSLVIAVVHRKHTRYH